MSNGDLMELSKNEQKLFKEISALIDQTKRNVSKNVDIATVSLFWHIGKMTNTHILKNKRADYGKQIVVSLARQLEEKYGRTFNEKNFRRMLQFAEQFNDEQIVVLLKRQFSWTHLLALLPIKNICG